jgi:hypothetical protein
MVNLKTHPPCDQECTDEKTGIELLDVLAAAEATKMTRRACLGILAMAVGLSGCRKERDVSSNPGSREPLPKSESSKAPDVAPEKFEWPEFEIRQTPFKFERPKNLNLGEAEFTKTSRAIVERLKEGLIKYFQPKLKEAKTPKDANVAIDGFIPHIAAMVGSFSPETENEMRGFLATWDRDPFSLVSHLNEYFNPAGYYLVYDVNMDGSYEFNLYEIEMSEQVGASYQGEAVCAPVLYLGKGILDTPVDPNLRAGCDRRRERILVYSDTFSKSVGDLKVVLAEAGINCPYKDSELEEKLREDLLRHEITHVLLSKKFPATVRRKSDERHVPLDLNVGIGNGLNANLTGVYPVASFHELCGIGVHIGKSELDIPYGVLMYFQDGMPESYQLVGKMIAIGVLRISPDTPEKAEAYSEISRTGKIEPTTLIKVIKNPSFTIEYYKKVGEILFKYGMEFLRKVESRGG